MLLCVNRQNSKAKTIFLFEESQENMEILKYFFSCRNVLVPLALIEDRILFFKRETEK